jgi:hypothetical protein
MKYGVQITTTKDGAWSVNQLMQKKANGTFVHDLVGGKSGKPKVTFVRCDRPNAALRLLTAVEDGLAGRMKGVCEV